jgi:hypothetical protein
VLPFEVELLPDKYTNGRERRCGQVGTNFSAFLQKPAMNINREDKDREYLRMDDGSDRNRSVSENGPAADPNDTSQERTSDSRESRRASHDTAPDPLATREPGTRPVWGRDEDIF